MINDKKQFIEIREMEQGSEQWHEWRKSVIGSSDTPVIMGENPFKSRVALINEKRGLAKPFQGNAKTRRGHLLEPRAREVYQSLLNFTVRPAVLQSKSRPWIAASVDGINFDMGALVEIKCGEAAYRHTEKTGKVPGYYLGQLQHIIFVSGLPSMDYLCYLPNREPLRLTIKRDEKYIDRMLHEQLLFKNELALQGACLRETLFYSTPSPKSTIQLDPANRPISANHPVPNPAKPPEDLILDKLTGKGVYVWPNGDRYEGDFVNGERTGKGRFIAIDGSRYEGDFVGGTMTGKGIFSCPSGARYVGDFVEAVRTGKGALFWENGDHYDGCFFGNEQVGHGVFTWANGNRYEGNFVGNKPSGKGVFTRANGERSEGWFVNGEQTGKGVYTWPDGSRYEGEFVKGEREGNGLFMCASGERFEGSFRRGIPVTENSTSRVVQDEDTPSPTETHFSEIRKTNLPLQNERQFKTPAAENFPRFGALAQKFQQDRSFQNASDLAKAVGFTVAVFGKGILDRKISVSSKLAYHLDGVRTIEFVHWVRDEVVPVLHRPDPVESINERWIRDATCPHLHKPDPCGSSNSRKSAEPPHPGKIDMRHTGGDRLRRSFWESFAMVIAPSSGIGLFIMLDAPLVGRLFFSVFVALVVAYLMCTSEDILRRAWRLYVSKK